MQLQWATADRALALGVDTLASGINATAVGSGSQATDNNAAAFGFQALAGNSSTSIGGNANASGTNAAAIGRLATAGGSSSAAIGREASAGGGSAVAIGFQSNSSNTRAIAIGAGSTANAGRSVAIGDSASAVHADAVAIGTNATSTSNSQVSLGGAGSSVRIGDIDASTAKQTGPVNAVTIDASGTLGKGAVASASQVSALQSSMQRALAVTDAQFGQLSGRVDDLERRFDLRNKALSGGIAAAAALGSAISMPDKRFTVGGNIATYNGEHGYAATVTGRVSDNFAIGAGIAGNSGDGEVIAQAGFALGF